MTVTSAIKQGEHFSIPANIISSIGRSTRHEGCGYVTLKGGTTYVCRESFGELAQMIAEDPEVE